MSKSKNYRELSVDELKTELEALSKERFGLRMQKMSGQAVKTHMLSLIRKQIAQIKFFLAQKGVKL